MLVIHLKVRSTASLVISSLIRCSNKELVKFILEKYSKVLAKKQLRSKSRDESDLSLNDRLKHSGILAFTALVHSYPYNVPDWMPSVITSLIENVSYSPLVANSVEKCLQEFKRTHQDTWDEDRLLFSDEQLEMINDLQIIPSYFV